MKTRKIPLRTCVVTGEKCDKRDLLRIVKTKDGEIFLDVTGKMNGKGAYIKKDISLVEIAKKKNSLGKKLECEINDEIYQKIEEILKS